MKGIISDEFRYAGACLQSSFLKPIQRSINLVQNLYSLYYGELPQLDDDFDDDFALNIGKENIVRKFKREIEEMGKNVTDGQTMAFYSQLITDSYKQEIVKMNKFVFHRKSRIVFDLSSYGSIGFSIIFPFEDLNEPAEKDCVALESLPKFFTSKGIQ